MEGETNALVHSRGSSGPFTQWINPSPTSSADMKIDFTKENLSSGGGVVRRTPSTSAGCIYGVPEKFYKQNEESYTPQTVEIGPIFRGEELVRPMQLNKESYYNSFFSGTVHDEKAYYVKAKFWEPKARACYQIKISQDPDEFVKMLLVDGIFVLEFLLRKCILRPEQVHDDIFDKESLTNDIFYDLILVENQLPFFVLNGLYDASYDGIPWEEFLSHVASAYFGRGVEIERVKQTLRTYHIRHLGDFLHALCVVSISKREVSSDHRQKFRHIRSATELHEAGVEFEKVDTTLPFDLAFSKDDEKLKFPAVEVNRWTDYFFRNFIAHEDCLHKDKIISSYIILIGNLLKSPKDVKLLVKKGIIINRSLRKSNEICTLFKNLYNRSMMENNEFYYTSLCKLLNEYSKNPWHQLKAAYYRWKEMLKRDYFSNPWVSISVLAASLVVVLTILQTVTSILTTKWGSI